MTDMLVETPLAPPSALGPYRAGDYLALPDEPRCELIYGRLYVSPSPTTAHQITVALLQRRIDRYAERTGGIVLFAPMDVHLSEHSIVQPDILYISRANRGIVRDHVYGAPDLLIEVLSPATARRDRGEKLRLYAEGGVLEYWLVDPATRQIEFLLNEDGRFVVVLPSDDAYTSPAIPDLHLDLAALWSDAEARLA